MVTKAGPVGLGATHGGAHLFPSTQELRASLSYIARACLKIKSHTAKGSVGEEGRLQWCLENQYVSAKEATGQE